MSSSSKGALRHIEYIPVGDLQKSPRNARTHSDKQVSQIAKSMRRFGFTNPVLIDDHNNILAGHGRILAAIKEGLIEVPCVRLSGLSDDEKRAYLLADNQLALQAGWDNELRALELKELMELDFDITVIGLEIGEIEMIIGEAEQADPKSTVDRDDRFAEPDKSKPIITQFGDLWQLGRHTLLCGNARHSEDVALLMAGEQADTLFTDPPWNVKINGHVSGLGRVKHREFAEASGEMTFEEFTQFLTKTLAVAASVCRDGAIAYVCMDWRHLRELLTAGFEVFSEFKQLCVWNKTNGGMGSFYRSQHELVLVWKVGTAPHLNTFGLGDKGRYRTNVWSYAGVNSFRADRMEELALHPTVKPVAMVADAIRDVTHRGQIVLDVFGGSGSTLIAAERTGRRARLLEIDPLYCDTIVRRWQSLTGKSATLASTGETFERMRILRTGWGKPVLTEQAA